MTDRLAVLKQRLAENELIILDGATGSEVSRRGVQTTLPLWSATALWTSPDTVLSIHADYIAAGADIITTNTFRTNPRVLLESGCGVSSREATLKACDLALAAREASGSNHVCIAGCVAPIEDCYEPDLVPPDNELLAEHAELAGHLAEGQVDFIFIETMNCVREASAAVLAAKQASMPYAISFICSESGSLLSGEPLIDALRMLEDYPPLFVCVNCRPPDQLAAGFESLLAASAWPVGIYANGAGCAEACNGWEFSHGGTAAESYLGFAKRWRAAGASVIGGCCGTSPEYIELLSAIGSEPARAAL